MSASCASVRPMSSSPSMRQCRVCGSTSKSSSMPSEHPDGRHAHALRLEVDGDLHRRVRRDQLRDALHVLLVELDAQDADLAAVRAEDVGEARGDDRSEARVLERPRRVLTRRPAAEVASGEQHLRTVMLGPIHREVGTGRDPVGLVAPLGERERTEAGALDALEVLLRDDLVRVDVVAGDRAGVRAHGRERSHRTSSLTSVRWPVIAAAAAIAGDTRWVRPL